MTLLQQENGMHRSAKKAVAHQGENNLVEGTVADTPVKGGGTMPRLARKWGQWVAQAENLQARAYLLHHRQVGPWLFFLVACFGKNLITKSVMSSIETHV
jgi:hypothetical protein